MFIYPCSGIKLLYLCAGKDRLFFGKNLFHTLTPREVFTTLVLLIVVDTKIYFNKFLFIFVEKIIPVKEWLFTSLRKITKGPVWQLAVARRFAKLKNAERA